MSGPSLHVVTGAFGNSGKYIARRLVALGHRVRTLTNSLQRQGTSAVELEARPLAFENVDFLTESLAGADVLYNTYWIRFNHRRFNQGVAVRNTLRLFEAAKLAGVRKVVHVSITHPSEESPLEYFRGKAILERALRESGLAFSILRPTVLFGEEDILVNNIAWTLRHLPFFGLPGDGSYLLQPIFVDDLADLAVRSGAAHAIEVIEAIGPETFTFRELVATIGQAIGKERPILALPPWAAFAGAKLLGILQRDVMLTWQEVQGLRSGLLHVDAPPAGTTKFTEWVGQHSSSLGIRYRSELARRHGACQAT